MNDDGKIRTNDCVNERITRRARIRTKEIIILERRTRRACGTSFLLWSLGVMENKVATLLERTTFDD